jgi:biotin transport system substrate-specific component
MRILTILAFAALIALSAQVSVPMVPVPMTLQTFAVLLAGSLLGPWRGAGAVLLYLALAVAGLPILSDGASGLGPFAGPTAGYLFAFPIAAFCVGVLFDRPRIRTIAGRLSLLISAHALILTLGAGWLATKIGLADAIAHGLNPFIAGAVVKSVLVLACALALRRLRPSSSSPPSPA